MQKKNMIMTPKEIKKLREQGTGLTSTGEVVNSAFLFISKKTLQQLKEQRDGYNTNRDNKNSSSSVNTSLAGN